MLGSNYDPKLFSNTKFLVLWQAPYVYIRSCEFIRVHRNLKTLIKKSKKKAQTPCLIRLRRLPEITSSLTLSYKNHLHQNLDRWISPHFLKFFFRKKHKVLFQTGAISYRLMAPQVHHGSLQSVIMMNQHALRILAMQHLVTINGHPFKLKRLSVKLSNHSTINP